MSFEIASLAKLKNKNDYLRFIQRFESPSYFHTFEYLHALQNSKNTKPIAIAVLDSNNNVVASTIGELADEVSYLPYLTRRLIVNAPPLYLNFIHLRYLLNHLKSLKVGLFIQVRSFNGFSSQELLYYSNSGFIFTDHLNAFIPLKNRTETDIFMDFKSDKRKGIKKALNKFNLSVIEPDVTDEVLKTFYEMQRKLFKSKRHSLKSLDYFRNMIATSKGKVRLVFAMFEDKPIATQLYILNNKTITALYTSTLEDHKDKYAGDLLIWHLLKIGLQKKLDTFDFGGGGKPGVEYGPRNYKERFGTIFENVGRLELPRSPFYKLANFIYKKIVR